MHVLVSSYVKVERAKDINYHHHNDSLHQDSNVMFQKVYHQKYHKKQKINMTNS